MAVDTWQSKLRRGTHTVQSSPFVFGLSTVDCELLWLHLSTVNRINCFNHPEGVAAFRRR